MKNEKGFTLIEMMIVLLVISVLLIISIPNIAKHNANINDKGCQAYVKMVETQVQAYHIDNQTYPTVQLLIDEGYLKSGDSPCSDDTTIVIDANGGVSTTISGT